MLQTTVAGNGLSESMPEIELKASDIGRDEIVELIKSEEVGTALQVILIHFADIIANRVLARLGSAPLPTPTQAQPQTVLPPATKSTEVPAPETPATRKKRQCSPEVKARISESQKKRWETRPRKLDDAAKAKISESQKKRWAVKNGNPVSTPRETDTPTEADSQGQHNNPVDVVETKVVSVPSEAVLATRDGYKGDPFYISFDGHYIGEDGFVVPKDFDEFLERYPKYIGTWVRRRLNGQGIEEDIEDWCQDLIIHMKYLPPKSKHRALGKLDVIETFDPFAQYGASERRWRNYVNYCLANKYNTIHGKRTKNPVCRAGNLSLVSETSPDMHGEVTDEYVHSNSTILSNATDREDKKAENTYFTHKFVAYVQAQDPEVFPVLEAIYVAGSSTDTIKEFCQTCKKLATTKELELGEHEGHEVGMSPKEFNRARNRLKQLAGMFLKHRNPIVKSS